MLHCDTKLRGFKLHPYRVVGQSDLLTSGLS
jgi:hypothetical protein